MSCLVYKHHLYCEVSAEATSECVFFTNQPPPCSSLSLDDGHIGSRLDQPFPSLAPGMMLPEPSVPWVDWETRRQKAQRDGGLQLCRVAPGFHMLLEHHFDRLTKGSTLWTSQKVTDKLKLVLADTSFHKQKVSLFQILVRTSRKPF